MSCQAKNSWFPCSASSQEQCSPDLPLPRKPINTDHRSFVKTLTNLGAVFVIRFNSKLETPTVDFIQRHFACHFLANLGWSQVFDINMKANRIS